MLLLRYTCVKLFICFPVQLMEQDSQCATDLVDAPEVS